MATNLDRYRDDLARLTNTGNNLLLAMSIAINPKTVMELSLSEKAIKALPIIQHEYQRWYSESLACITQLLPARAQDFINYYKPEKTRKDITYANYTVSDYLRGLTVTFGYEKNKVVGPDAAISPLQQQVQMVTAARQRLESSLFDIRALVQADLFDNELDSAEELNRRGFQRGAGAIARVVLEAHLAEVCNQHQISIPKNPHISDLNEILKKNNVLDVPNWRFVQHLGDLRNLCDHKKSKDPTNDQIHELIEGVRKIVKTIF